MKFSQIKIFTLVPLPAITQLVVCTPIAFSISICNAIIMFSGICCFGLQTLTLDYGGYAIRRDGMNGVEKLSLFDKLR